MCGGRDRAGSRGGCNCLVTLIQPGDVEAQLLCRFREMLFANNSHQVQVTSDDLLIARCQIRVSVSWSVWWRQVCEQMTAGCLVFMVKAAGIRGEKTLSGGAVSLEARPGGACLLDFVGNFQHPSCQVQGCSADLCLPCEVDVSCLSNKAGLLLCLLTHHTSPCPAFILQEA